MSKTYPDIRVTEGDQTMSYSKEGWKARRTFILDNVSMSSPSSTLFDMLQGAYDEPSAMQLPYRGSPHPTIKPFSANNAYGIWFGADVVTARAKTSTQAEVWVDYAILNGMTQEPGPINNGPEDGLGGDNAIALLTAGSSVQTKQTSEDAAGNTLIVPYAASIVPSLSIGAYTISVNGINGAPTQTSGVISGSGSFTPGFPNIKTTASIQVPNQLLRFQRREQKPHSPLGLVGYVNSADWTIPQLGETIPAGCALMTRMENSTLDEGSSAIVLYEFQVAELQDIPSAITGSLAAFVHPATYSSGGGMSPWYAVAYYVVPGTGSYATGTPPAGQPSTLIAGSIPPDALPFVFQIYPTFDFTVASSNWNPVA